MRQGCWLSRPDETAVSVRYQAEAILRATLKCGIIACTSGLACGVVSASSVVLLVATRHRLPFVSQARWLVFAARLAFSLHRCQPEAVLRPTLKCGIIACTSRLASGVVHRAITKILRSAAMSEKYDLSGDGEGLRCRTEESIGHNLARADLDGSSSRVSPQAGPTVARQLSGDF